MVWQPYHHQPMVSTESGQKANVLIVDDQPDNLRLLSTILQTEGYRVRQAMSGAMALETVSFQVPDLILLDIRMPVMDGFAVCQALRQLPLAREIPILFISASDAIDDKVKAFEIGGSDYITKPFSAREVLARVQYQLTIQQQQQELVTLYRQVQQFNAHLEEQVQARTHELQQALEKIQRLNQLKDDFLSTISHELRTPLANIRMVVQLLVAATQDHDFFQNRPDVEANATTETPIISGHKITQYLTILQQECDRELRLVQDLLDLQQLRADVALLQPIPINLYDWVPHVLEPFETRTQTHQQTLRMHLAPNLPLLETDPHSLTRILTELLDNACKYTPPGEGIWVEAHLTEVKETSNQPAEGAKAPTNQGFPEQPNRSIHPKSEIVICVMNSGVEIPVEELPRVFDKFYRIPSRDPWKHGGTGLGLALVKKLAEHLQGSIEVTSFNQLTRFTLRLPIRIAP